MRIGIIGRSEILYDTVLELKNAGHKICFIITSKEAPEYRKKSEDFYKLSKRLNIPFEKGSDIIKFKGLIKKKKPDVGVSLNFTKLIPKEIIDLFPLGILNAHGGDLPKYRGNACQAWAILNGEKRIGLCIHKMVGNELDNGDIIAKDYIKINDNTKITEVLNWIKINTKIMYLNVINKLEEKPNFILEKQSKNVKDILRCYPRQPQDGRIKWNKTSIYIHRLINASNKPYSGAYCFFKEKKMIVWDSEILQQEISICAIPGQITFVGKNFVDVACGQGELRCKLIEYENKVMKPNDLIKSIRSRLT